MQLHRISMLIQSTVRALLNKKYRKPEGLLSKRLFKQYMPWLGLTIHLFHPDNQQYSFRLYTNKQHFNMKTP